MNDRERGKAVQRFKEWQQYADVEIALKEHGPANPICFYTPLLLYRRTADIE
jgi:hypothetical protein